MFLITLTSKNGVCDDSPIKKRTGAEGFAWRLAWIRCFKSNCGHVEIPEFCCNGLQVVGNKVYVQTYNT